ncbi:unnamed protein product [Alopecurus aequalis]
MADTSKRLDLALPLLSVRRHGKAGAGTRYGERDEDAMLGGVPFRWEHWPGRPKSVRTIIRRAPPLLPEPEEAARSSDALSRADSCYTVNCSVAGLSDAAGVTASPGAHGSSVMMDRFLLAAKEQCAFRKAKAVPANTRARDGDSLPSRLLVEHPPASQSQASYVTDTNDGDEDELDAHSTAGFASRRTCVLLPTRCAKILNPAHAISRHRRGARRFLSDLGRSCQRDTKPLLPQRRPAHDAGMRSWEEVHISSLVGLVRSDRACSLREGATMAATGLDRTVRGLCNGQAGAAARPKAAHLGLLLVLDRTDDGAGASLRRPLKRGQPVNGGKTSSRRNAAGHVFPPLFEEMIAESREAPPVLLALPSPKMPTESWLSRTLPSVSTKPPATSFLGIHVQQLRKQQTPPPFCSSDQAKAVHHGARPRRVRIHDLQK